ncbi:unnamed protein product [Leptosia nina]|uniref:Uncharacterized protein n=1 Tax=Leptosia nina TaxID=320188 RepID=A0AAV1JYA7_9NEOP
MSDYAKLKKLDEESLQKLQEGTGPVDECLCSIFSPEVEKRSLAASVKKAFGFSGKKNSPPGGRRGFPPFGERGGNFVEIPLTFSNDGRGIFTKKEVVKRNTPCGKCGCDNENIVLKHSYANIRISTPDISSICPCDSNCLPDKEKLQNNIKVTVERADVSSQSIPNFYTVNNVENKKESE